MQRTWKIRIQSQSIFRESSRQMAASFLSSYFYSPFSLSFCRLGAAVCVSAWFSFDTCHQVWSLSLNLFFVFGNSFSAWWGSTTSCRLTWRVSRATRSRLESRGVKRTVISSFILMGRPDMGHNTALLWKIQKEWKGKWIKMWCLLLIFGSWVNLPSADKIVSTLNREMRKVHRQNYQDDINIQSKQVNLMNSTTHDVTKASRGCKIHYT